MTMYIQLRPRSRFNHDNISSVLVGLMADIPFHGIEMRLYAETSWFSVSSPINRKHVLEFKQEILDFLGPPNCGQSWCPSEGNQSGCVHVRHTIWVGFDYRPQQDWCAQAFPALRTGSRLPENARLRRRHNRCMCFQTVAEQDDRDVLNSNGPQRYSPVPSQTRMSAHHAGWAGYSVRTSCSSSPYENSFGWY